MNTARQLLPLMTRITPTGDDARAALDLLRRWDLRMDGDKPEITAAGTPSG